MNNNIKLLITITVAIILNVVESKDCVKETKNGYTSFFTLTSFNTYFPNGNNTPSLISFTEFGFTSVDFKGQRMRVDYEIIMENNTVNGSWYGYGQTNSMYIVSNGNCTRHPLTFPIPPSYPWNETNNLGSTKLGQFPVDIYSLNKTFMPINQTVFYDKKKCVVVSAMMKNADPTVRGHSLMNYFEFENKFENHYFDLPSECQQLHNQPAESVYRHNYSNDRFKTIHVGGVKHESQRHSSKPPQLPYSIEYLINRD